MPGPRVTIDLEAVERNAAAVVAACAAHGISVIGVTKGTCGLPAVARAMLRGGVAGIGESRFENIRRLRESGIECPVTLLRSPPLSLVEETIATVDTSLHSELQVLAELSRVAERMSRVHDVVLMVDLGDLREGVWPDELLPTVERVMDLPGVRIVGLGTNLSCFGGVVPSVANMEALAAQAEAVEARLGRRLAVVSGGNSSSLPLVLDGLMPARIDQLRVGEAILKGGQETGLADCWPALAGDAFRLEAELIEVKRKPSRPIGEIGLDAFGRRPEFDDRGERLRGILNIGREDVMVEGLTPTEAGVEVLGASSDHLVVDLADARPAPCVGDVLGFRMSYGALLAAMTSEYVEKRPLLERADAPASRAVRLAVAPALEPVVAEAGLRARLAALGYDVLDVDGGGTPRAGGGPADTWLSVGADHDTTVAGLARLAADTDAFGLVWLDARAGFVPCAAGEPAGPASSLYRALGLGDAGGAITPNLSPENTVLVGLRDVAAEEVPVIHGSRVRAFTMSDIDAVGIAAAMREALRIAGAGTRGVYLSYCPEVTDIPGTALAAAGITLRETHLAMEIVARSRSLLAMDVVGLAPGAEARVRAETFGFVLSAFGKEIL